MPFVAVCDQCSERVQLDDGLAMAVEQGVQCGKCKKGLLKRPVPGLRELPAGQPAWEYHACAVTESQLQERLTELGRQGWELFQAGDRGGAWHLILVRQQRG